MTKVLTYVEIDIPAFSTTVDTSLLNLQMEGADGSTAITDSSSPPHVVTAVGSAQIDNAQFHSGSTSLLLGTTAADCLTLDGSSDFAFGTGDFSIEFWFRLATNGSQIVFYDSLPNASPGGFYIQIFMTSGNNVGVWINNAVAIIGGTSVTTGVWHELILERVGGITSLYLDGVQQGSSINPDTASYLNGASRPAIGGNGSSFGSQSVTGWMDDLIIYGAPSTPDSPDVLQTFRFATDTGYLPSDIDAIPSIVDVQITPGIISLGGNLGQRASVEVRFRDHKHIFASEAYDSGTFWGKFRARYGLRLRGYPLRVYRGVVGDVLDGMETRHFIIENTDGPTTKGEYRIVAKDILKFADGDRAQAPPLSGGFLLTAITTTDTMLSLSPTGAGDLYYSGQGYVAIGGNEIVKYNRAGIDDLDVLLLHADGNSPGDIIDALSTPHTITKNGNVTSSTAESKFGGASILFDGAGDYLTLDGSSEFAFGTADFCIDFWVRFASVAGTQVLYDSRPAGTVGVYVLLFLTGTKIVLHINSSNRITGATTIVVNTWYHVALTRTGNLFTLFLNGVSDGADTTAFTLLNGASRPAIGSSGNTINTDVLNGYIDELRVSNGAARYIGTFAVPTAPYSAAGSGDLMSVIRAQYNTVAVAHEAGDRVQLCVEYLSEDVADVIYDLLTTYADVDPDYITLANWQTETATYLTAVYSALIAEPTSVAQLVSELIEQASLAVWWDDVSQQIRLQVLRAVSTAADTYNDDNILMGTLEVKEQPEKRISQVYMYFNKLNPLVNEDQIDNYGSSVFTIDEAAELEYGSASIKKIFSRWIPEGGRAVAESINDILLARFVTPPRRISFDVMRYAGAAPGLGLGYQVAGWPFQEQDGTAAAVSVQVVRLNPRPDIFEVEAEEVFAGADAAPDSPNDHVILIDSNTLNVNLRDMHDSIYAEATSGVTVYCTILAGVLVGSASTSSPAFDVGSWAAGVAIDLTVLGTIEGAGGAGGAPVTVSAGNPGGAGGTALYTRYAIALRDLNGAIWGGGGGGGSGGGPGTSGSGGGGAGQSPGSPGATTSAGGSGLPGFAGGSVGRGGDGGGPGLAGSSGFSGTSYNGGAGGAAGNWIDGNSFVTTASGPGDRRGGTI